MFEQWFGERRTDLEQVVIKSAVFNQPIPPETFTLAGIKMLPKHPIQVGDETRSQKVVDGKILPMGSNANSTSDPVPPPSAAPVRVAEPGEWQMNPWLLAAAVVLALAAVVLLVFKFRQRRPAP
jgi:hypothetical protein